MIEHILTWFLTAILLTCFYIIPLSWIAINVWILDNKYPCKNCIVSPTCSIICEGIHEYRMKLRKRKSIRTGVFIMYLSSIGFSLLIDFVVKPIYKSL